MLFKVYSSTYVSTAKTSIIPVEQIISQQNGSPSSPSTADGATSPGSVSSDQTPNTSNSLPPAVHSGERANATFITLARNNDIWEIAKSIRQVEDRFNRKFNYDWVFLNDKPFDAQFKKITTALVSGNTKYGLIPKEHWSFPDWIDQDKAKKVREDMVHYYSYGRDGTMLTIFE